MLKGSILVAGSLNMDQIVRVPRLPGAGETLLGSGSVQLAPGGKGANQAVAMARLGGKVEMAGRIGRDLMGERLQKALLVEKIGTQLLSVDENEATGAAFIFLTPDGDNAIIVAPGANYRVGKDPQQMKAILERIPRVSALVLQLEIPIEAITTLVAAAHKAGIPIILNLAPARPLSYEFLRQLSVLIVNESEATLLSGQRIESLDDAKIVANVLHERGIPTVVVTLGDRGSLLVTNNAQGKAYQVYQATPEVNVVDTTAAGDCFTGAFTIALIEGKSPRECLRFATYAGALKVTRFGAQPGLPGREEVEAFQTANPI